MSDKLDYHLLIDCMCRPERLRGLNVSQLDGVLRYARRASLLGSLAARARTAAVDVPHVAHLFEGAALYAAEHARRIEWELQQLAPLVRSVAQPVVVLKGGAYLGMRLDSAAGRLVSDLDLLVPQAALAGFEAAMRNDGYRAQKQDAYDQHYYRAWMHELPPMSHVARGTMVDVHHNIAPPVSRLKIDADQLLRRARPLRDDLPYLRLGDEDMVLHLCVHMFHDGELHNALRELFDLDALLRRFGADPGFWQRLSQRARQLELERPLYYGVRFSTRLLGTPVASQLLDELRSAAPLPPMRWLLQAAMRRSILPDTGERPSAAKAFAEWLLFLRAHWLRMPPAMLARHLWTQFRRRGGLKTGEQAAMQDAGRG